MISCKILTREEKNEMVRNEVMGNEQKVLFSKHLEYKHRVEVLGVDKHTSKQLYVSGIFSSHILV